MTFELHWIEKENEKEKEGELLLAIKEPENVTS